MAPDPDAFDDEADESMRPAADHTQRNVAQRIYRQQRQLSLRQRQCPQKRTVPPRGPQTRVYGGEPPGVLALRLFYGTNSASEP